MSDAWTPCWWKQSQYVVYGFNTCRVLVRKLPYRATTLLLAICDTTPFVLFSHFELKEGTLGSRQSAFASRHHLQGKYEGEIETSLSSWYLDFNPSSQPEGKAII